MRQATTAQDARSGSSAWRTDSNDTPPGGHLIYYRTALTEVLTEVLVAVRRCSGRRIYVARAVSLRAGVRGRCRCSIRRIAVGPTGAA